jgi:flagellar FliL protein
MELQDPEFQVSSAPPAAPKKSKTLVIVLATLLLLGGAGAGAWWFLAGSKAGTEAGVQRKSQRKPVFVNLDPFTVNLRDERGERFAQIGITFEVEDPSVEVAIKDHLPAVRNNILLLISAKNIEQLLTAEGKQQLASEVRAATGAALGVAPQPAQAAVMDGHPIRAVLFSQFIVQ